MAAIEKMQFGKQEVTFTLKKSSRARTIKLTALRGEGFVVTVPLGVTHEYVRKILLGKRRWILGKIGRASCRERV